MKMVSAVVTREQLRGVARVTQNRIEIDDAVESTAAEDPSVDLLSHALFFASVESVSRLSFSSGRILSLTSSLLDISSVK
jgi:hypothetical protein